MQAFIILLTVPFLPLLIHKLSGNNQGNTRDTVIRYGLYTLIITAVTSLVMVFLCEDNTSFLEKIDRSPGFALKFLAVAIAAALITAIAEWLYAGRRVILTIDKTGLKDHAISRFFSKIPPSAGVFLLAAIVVLMNVSLLFDNVLWGDEAYSALVIKNNISDMLQVLILEDCHPPLYYLWLKLWAELLGYQGVVYHFASFLAFLIGVILALVLLRKRFGNIPTAFYLILAGMAAPCLEYNIEVRMYSLAFLGVTYGFYSAYCVLQKDGWGWAGLVFFGLVGAYSHYYALMIAVIMLVLTGLLACLIHRGRIWLKALLALAVFIIGYAPWLSILLTTMESVSNNWWMTETISLQECLTVILGGNNMKTLLLPFLLLIIGLGVIMESALITVRKKEEKVMLTLQGPKLAGWTKNLYALVLGSGTIALTLIAAYLACILVRPVLAARYVYPLTGVVCLLAVIAACYLLDAGRRLSQQLQKNWIRTLTKGLLLVLMAVFLYGGVKDYRILKAENEYQQTKTEEILNMIGEGNQKGNPANGITAVMSEVSEYPVLVNNDVTHIGWTVLSYYFPENEILNAAYNTVQADDFWYFTTAYMSGEQLQEMTDQGYLIYGYGEKQLSKYSFILYRFQRRYS